MKAISNIADVAPSTFASRRGHMYFYSRLYADAVRRVQVSGISNAAKLTYFYLQPLLKQSDEPGYLVMNGQPMSTKTLASLLGIKKVALEKNLEELIDIGLLSKKISPEIPTMFDPIMALDEEASSYENDRKSAKDDPSRHNRQYSTVEESRATNRSDYSTLPTTKNRRLRRFCRPSVRLGNRTPIVA